METFYSLSGEDKFIYENFFKNKKRGTYIELGANNGVTQSNTKYFEDYHNWYGILIEADNKAFSELEINRPNNFLFNELISNSKEELSFTFMTELSLVASVTDTFGKQHNDFWFGEYSKK